MKVQRFIGKVLQDGHLSLPERLAKEKDKVFEVILIPLNEIAIYDYAEALAKEKGFASYDEQDVERIVHESRGIKK